MEMVINRINIIRIAWRVIFIATSLYVCIPFLTTVFNVGLKVQAKSDLLFAIGISWLTIAFCLSMIQVILNSSMMYYSSPSNRQEVVGKVQFITSFIIFGPIILYNFFEVGMLYQILLLVFAALEVMSRRIEREIHISEAALERIG